MTTTAEHALFLAGKIDLLANREDVGRFRSDVFRLIETIERMVNRPRPPRFLGPCPTEIGHHKKCATTLLADHKADEVTCHTCQVTYLADDLIAVMRNELAYHPFTATNLLGKRTSELPGVLDQLQIPVPRSTLYGWIKTGVLQSCGYLTTRGAFSHTQEHDTDERAYYLADVRRLRGDTDPPIRFP